MDLSSPKVTPEQKLDLCKKYFFLGFALLPFLWAVNAVWFAREAFLRKPEYPEQKAMKRYVVASATGATVFLVAFVSWVVVFSNHRAAWGELGDRLSFNIPTGQQ